MSINQINNKSIKHIDSARRTCIIRHIRFTKLVLLMAIYNETRDGTAVRKSVLLNKYKLHTAVNYTWLVKNGYILREKIGMYNITVKGLSVLDEYELQYKLLKAY